MQKYNLSKNQIKKKFMSYKEASELYGIGLTRMQEYAKKAGATYKIGNKVLVNTEIFDVFIEQYRIPGEIENVVKNNLQSKYQRKMVVD